MLCYEDENLTFVFTHEQYLAKVILKAQPPETKVIVHLGKGISLGKVDINLGDSLI